MKIYTVKDKKADTHNAPFTQRNNTTAARAFGMEVNRQDENNVIYTHPEDFDLYYIGDFDADTGTINAANPELVATGKQLKNKDTK